VVSGGQGGYRSPTLGAELNWIPPGTRALVTRPVIRGSCDRMAFVRAVKLAAHEPGRHPPETRADPWRTLLACSATAASLLMMIAGTRRPAQGTAHALALPALVQMVGSVHRPFHHRVRTVALWCWVKALGLAT
jgi:hypothetical protein